MHDEFMQFLRNHQDVDIFCFQEVYNNAEGKDTLWLSNNFNCLEDIKKVLVDHVPHYHPHLGDWWGLAMFIRKGIEINEVGEVTVHKDKGYDFEKEKRGYTSKNVQYVTTVFNGMPLSILNIHGLWNGQGKADSEERIIQSQRIIDFAKKIPHDFIFCGDFNLLPETKSLKMIEEELNLQNLIKDFGITSTRTSFYEKPDKFADYVFATKGVKVLNFKVLPEEVSDHVALEVEL